MAYKTILAYLPKPEQAGAILDVAAPLARQQGAHLIALHVIPRVPVIYGLMSAQVPPEIISEQDNMLQEQADGIEKIFNDRTALNAATSEWRCNKLKHANMASDVIHQALCAELIVVGQDKPDGIGPGISSLSSIIYESGRPVLVVPHGQQSNRTLKRILIAWNASRESARAAFDAMPVLESADFVRILAVDPPADDHSRDIILGQELALSLARHGVSVETSVAYRNASSISEVLNRQADDDNSDLIVMGCYGRSAIRESILGGTTQDMLNEMQHLVLMSH